MRFNSGDCLCIVARRSWFGPPILAKIGEITMMGGYACQPKI